MATTVKCPRCRQLCHSNNRTFQGNAQRAASMAVGLVWSPVSGADVAANLTSYVAVSGVASAMKFIPDIGTVGGALIMSTYLYVVTLVSEWVYPKALCMMVQRNGTGVNANDLESAVDEVLANKRVNKEMLTATKKDYKNF